MTDQRLDAVVLGGGFAGATAAATLDEHGADTTVVDGGDPGLVGAWNGLGCVYGPATPLLPDTAGRVERPATIDRPFDEKTDARWERLVKRRGDRHPYRRLGLGRRQLEETVAAALDALGDVGVTRLAPDAVLPGPGGLPIPADVAAPSLTGLDFRKPSHVALVECDALEGWNAEAVAETLARADGLSAKTVQTSVFDELEGRHPVRAATRFEEIWEEREDQLVTETWEVLEPRVDVAIFPPVLGASARSHDEIRGRWADALDPEVAEFPAGHWPVFGWRTHGRLVDETPENRVTGDPVDLRVDSEEIVVALDDGREIRASAAILATGSWVDGGRDGRPPLVEPLTGEPLWIDGAPIDVSSRTHPPDLLEDVPWGDHPLFRAGLPVDSTGRVLDRNGDPLADRVYAAGRGLAGFNPVHDACSFGVDLATGRLTAENAASSLDA